MQRKVVIIGAGGVGKTSFVKRLFGCGFEPAYEPTTQTEIYTTPSAETSVGNVTLNIWDFPGQTYNSGDIECYILGADIAIVMFDVSSFLSYKEAKKWQRRVKEIVGYRIETILCGNKCDIRGRKVVPSLDYFDVSTKTGYNMDNVAQTILYRVEVQETRELVNQMCDE